MGDVQSLPVIGEAVTVVECGTKVIAGGTCALFGAQDKAEQLFEGAGKSINGYMRKNVDFGGIRLIRAAIAKDGEEPYEVINDVSSALAGVAEGTPVIGHVKGIYHYLAHNKEAGDRCMYKTARTCAVIGAGVASGGLAAIGGGASVDVTVSYMKGESVGTLKALDKARYQSDDPNNHVDLGLMLVGDMAIGKD